MRRTIPILSAGVLALGLLAIALFGTALAQPILGVNAVAQQQDQQGQGSCHADNAGENMMLTTLAKALGTGESQLATELEAGKSLKDIALSRGLDDQKLAAALNGAMREAMKLHVQSGDLSQAEADAMLKHLDQMGPDHLLGMIDGGMSGDMASCEMMDDATDGSAMGGMPAGGAMAPDMMGEDGEGCHGDGMGVVF
ncbi:MAG: hypothetical protein HYY30_09560 [Chloroflexi bacterium]|nr:hypothetical protein [Chloroflexota bacterium]